MEQKLVLVRDNNYEKIVNDFFKEGWWIKSISGSGSPGTLVNCWVLFERPRDNWK